MVILSVMYPATQGATFDWDYYTGTHIPLAQDAFGATGLTGAQVLKPAPTPDGSTPPYLCIANLSFTSPDALQASIAGPHAAKVFADIANFTSVSPVTQVSLPL